MDPEIQKRVDYWLSGPFDEKTKEQVRLLQKDPTALVDAFFAELSFGTGGLRGLMGAGTTRLNIYTIRLATQGLANYIFKQQESTKASVLIGFDSRHHSLEFAQQAAQVLAGNGITVYLLDALRPTPYISFACREKKASAAVMITASHNPKEYNGYKVYWSDGAQVVSPHDTGIVEEVEALKDLSSVKLAPLTSPLIEITSTAALDEAYLKAIRPLQVLKKPIALKIVYTSLHGTGITLVPRALADWGFSTLHLVKPQVTIDGNFPTVVFPNPEYKETLKLCTQELERIDADIAIATDPDADRIGVVARHKGASVRLNGNEMAAICAHFLSTKQTMPPQAAFVTTIVTTELLKKIATASGIALIEVLTGFKYIGEKIHLWETTPQGGKHFVIGAEESYGCLWGTHARDKDAIIASCLIASIAAQKKLEGKTLVDALHEIYTLYGVHREQQLSIDFTPGKIGIERIQALMHTLRSNPPGRMGDLSVSYIEDYKTRLKTTLATKKTSPLELPISDVLLLRLEDDSRLIIRPSGTEPKVKIYAATSAAPIEDIQGSIQACDQHLKVLLDAIKKHILCQN